MLGQLFTLRDTISLLFDLLTGSLDAHFYAAAIEIGVVLPMSLWLLFTVMDTDGLREAAHQRLRLRPVAGGRHLLPRHQRQFPRPLDLAGQGHAWQRTGLRFLILIGIFAMPVVGTLLFANKAGAAVAGVAAVPLLATFLFGTVQVIGHMRCGQLGDELAAEAHASS